MPDNGAQQIKERIHFALQDFTVKPFNLAARALIDILGYRSDRDERVLKINTVDHYLTWLEQSNLHGKLTENDRKEVASSLAGLNFLFQLTDSEIRDALSGHVQENLFESKETVDS